MKVFIITLIFFVAAQAEIDRNSVHSLKLSPPGLGSKRASLNLNKPTGRITGGEEVVPHSLPYQAAIFFPTTETSAICGGSLIAKNVVLTAARCVDKTKNLTVVLGAHNIVEWEDTQVQIEAEDVIVHPEWDSLIMQNDLALVILPKDVELNENVQLVKLPSPEDIGNDYEDAVGVASGWGKDSDHATAISPVLRKVDMNIHGNTLCDLFYPGQITSTQLCSSAKGGKSTCDGDDGGPLVVNGTLVGVYSYGLSWKCEIGWAPVFTRVTEYVDWIQNNLAKID